MQRRTSNPPPDGYVAATIGMFDGVHLGHLSLIDQTRKAAGAAGLRSVVVTLDRHPFATVRPELTPRLLTGLEHKVELLYAAGVDDVVVLEFDASRAAQSAEDFVSQFLVEELEARLLVVGASFRLGHRQRGDVELLKTMGADLGFDVDVVSLLDVAGEGVIVSSSRIRELISAGRLGEAAKFLGREHEVRGTLSAEATVVVPAELLLPPAGKYPVGFSVAGSTGAANAIVGEQIEHQDSTVALVDITGGGRRATAERVAIRFVARDAEPGDAAMGR